MKCQTKIVNKCYQCSQFSFCSLLSSLPLHNKKLSNFAKRPAKAKMNSKLNARVYLHFSCSDKRSSKFVNSLFRFFKIFFLPFPLVAPGLCPPSSLVSRPVPGPLVSLLDPSHQVYHYRLKSIPLHKSKTQNFLKCKSRFTL